MKEKTRTKVDDLKDVFKRKKDAADAANLRAEKQDEVTNESDPNPPANSQDSNDGATVDEMADQIRSAEEEAKGHYDKLLRVMAEFDNFKKRMQREREEMIRYGNDKILTEMLSPLDDLDRVLDHIPQEASAEVKTIAEGIELLRKSFKSILEKYGLKEIAAQGEKFDPNCHEAIAMVDSDAHDAGSVMAVHRKGYKLEERLLRPALVSVVKERS